MEYYAAITREEIPTHAKAWMNLEDILFSEISYKKTNVV